MSGRVYVLGAGFSKAVNPRMPVMSELSEEVYRSMDLAWHDEWGSDLQGNVELLLTHLASEHPWEDEGRRHEALGYYHQIKEVMTHWIRQAEHEVVTSTGGPPQWLLDLCRTWHRKRSSVITFNYDCLVEYAVRQAGSELRDMTAVSLYPVPITPALSRTQTMPSYERRGSFSLHKLHGSLNWWYSGPDAPPGDTVYGTGLAREWGAPQDPDDAWAVDDKEVLVVPPTLQKESFYRNSILRRQWSLARQRLAEADSIVFIGYSLPMADLTSRLLISTSRDQGSIELVDSDPDTEPRIAKALPGFEVRQVAAGPSALSDYVEMLREEP